MTESNNNLNKIDSKKFFSITYGCQMNENDTERLAGQLRCLGYEEGQDMESADLIFINTCCVRESAENKIYGKIGELKRLKSNNPNLIVGVTGCMAQKNREKLFKRAPHIDFILGTHNVHQLIKVVKDVEESKQQVLAVIDSAEEMPSSIPTARKGGVSAWVTIMYGCNNFCTYCIVPYVRGRERSREVVDIIEEIKQLSATGVKEVTLLGQNVNSYGKDNNGADFADLLAEIDKVDGIERIRYMTSHPRDMNDKVIETIKNSNKICEHFHLPIQSGCNEILKEMNRGYTVEYYKELVQKIRTALPNASITTDLIMGFPGETPDHFAETLELIKAIKYDAAYTFLYSKRSGTPAATMLNQVELSDKKKRLQALMAVQNDISLNINKSYEGKVVEVMVEGPSKSDKTRFTGRTRTNKIVIWDKQGDEATGDLINVKITKAQTWVLNGELI